ncbi:MAG: MCP four helix bundle domain-containing protein, partial [Proteobacteria bacterium]|nr:MCP four helix bundle domain-containing protein [Pseudomonadota bacterium]
MSIAFMSNLGIKARLMLAFGAIMAAMVVVGGLGWYFLSQVGSSLGVVATRDIPQVVGTLELATSGEAVAAVAPALYAAANEAERQRQMARLQEAQRAMAKALDRVLGSSDDARASTELKSLSDTASARLDTLNKAVQERLTQAKAAADNVRALGEAHNRFLALAQPAIDKAKAKVSNVSMSISGDARALTLTMLQLATVQMPTMQYLADLVGDANLVVGLLSDAASADDAKQLGALQEKFRAAVERIELQIDVLDKINKVEGLRAATDAILALGSGAKSVFALRSAQFAANESGLKAIDEARRNVESLIQAVSRRVEATRARTDQSTQQAQSMVATSITMIMAIVAASLIGAVLFVWFYVGRNVVGRLVGLERNMTVLASGNLDTKIDASGSQDEVGAMAKALIVFKDGMVKARTLAEQQAKEQASKVERAERVKQLTEAFDQRIGRTLSSVDTAVESVRGSADSMSSAAQTARGQSTSVAAAAEQASTNVQTVASA